MMRTRESVTGRLRAAAAVLMLVPLVLQGQNGPLPSDWQAVKTISAGARVEATLRSGERVKGEFAAATDDSITVVKGGRSREIARQDVSRLYRPVAASKAKRVAIGAAIGGGIGAAVGGVAYSKGDFVKGVIPGAALIGAGIGALVGLLASAKGSTVLVYAAYPPQ